MNGGSEPPTGRDLLLIAEDNPADLGLIRLALQHYGLTCEIYAVPDGEAAVRFIESVEKDQSAPCPALAIFDLNLPRLSGVEILRRVRSSERWRTIPVIVASSSQSLHDRTHAIQLGASAYFPKPSDLQQFMKIGALVGDLLANSARS